MPTLCKTCIVRNLENINKIPSPWTDDTGIRRSAVVNWYLKTIEKDIDTEEELAEKKVILDKVLDRLIISVSRKSLLITIF